MCVQESKSAVERKRGSDSKLEKHFGCRLLWNVSLSSLTYHFLDPLPESGKHDPIGTWQRQFLSCQGSSERGKLKAWCCHLVRGTLEATTKYGSDVVTDPEVPVKDTMRQGRWLSLSVCGKRMEGWGFGRGWHWGWVMHTDAEENVRTEMSTFWEVQ